MKDRTKVLEFEPETRHIRIHLARLPASVHSAHDKGVQLVIRLLGDFFEQADDSLFELADQAWSNQEQNLYFDAMREVRVQRHSIESGVSEAIAEAFAALTLRDHPASGYTQARSRGPMGIYSDELEEMVALDTSVARAEENFAELLQQVSQQLDALVPVKVYQKNNPFGPHSLCLAFMEQMRPLDLDIKAKLLLLTLFDMAVVGRLDRVYELVNQLLTHGADEAQSTAVYPKAVASVPKPTEATSDYLVRAPTVIAPELAAMLQQLLGHRDEAEADQQTTKTQLLSLLTIAQRLPAVQAGASGNLDVRALLDSVQQQQKNSQAKIAPADAEVIGLVNKLFEVILADQNLAAPMKALIGQLQIPIAKVALADKSFFTQGGHAARRLLDEMAIAALGWQGEPDETDALYSKIQDVVSRILADFEADESIFSELLIDLAAFREKEHRRAAVLERRTLDAEDGKARAELARAAVAAEIDQRIAGRPLPEVVEKFIKEAWSNVLFITSLKFGTASPEWEQALTTLDNLIWSLQPPSRADDRQRLIDVMPELLAQLGSGLEAISYKPLEMSQLFQSLREIHLALIAGQTPAAPSEPANIPAANMTEAPVLADQLSHPDKLPDDDPHMQQVAAFRPGSWFEMPGDEGKTMRCRLAACIKPADKYIFVNRSGLKMAQKTSSELAWLLKQGNLSSLDNSMLFDRALETVVAGLRMR